MNGILLAQAGATSITILWSTSALAVDLFKRWHDKDAPEAAYWFFHEFRPLYIPAALAAYLINASHDGITFWNLSALTAAGINWWLFRNSGNDDDRWKRRRKRLTERVAVIGGRLAVVAGGAK